MLGVLSEAVRDAAAEPPGPTGPSRELLASSKELKRLLRGAGLDDVRVSTPAAAATVTASSCKAVAASFKSNVATSPICTRTRTFCGAIPICRTVTSYSPGTRPRRA